MAEASDFTQAFRFFLPAVFSFCFRVFALGYKHKKSTVVVMVLYLASMFVIPLVAIDWFGYYSFAKFTPLSGIISAFVILYISCDKPLPTLFMHLVQLNVVMLISIVCNTIRHLFSLSQAQVVLLMIAIYIPVFAFSYSFLRKPLRFMIDHISRRWSILLCLPSATEIAVLAVTVYSEYAFREQFLYAGFVVCMIEFSFLTCMCILYANVRDFCSVSQLAQIDSLTGLYNRAIAEQLITQTLNLPQGNQMHALVMMDIDNFKQINDTFGHAYGDEALRIVAQEMKTVFNENMVLSRFGGDEFCIFAADISSPQKVFERCNAFRKKVETHKLGKGALSFTVCMGITVTASGNNSFDVLYKNADTALYTAKKAGKNRVSLFSAIP